MQLYWVTVLKQVAIQAVKSISSLRNIIVRCSGLVSKIIFMITLDTCLSLKYRIAQNFGGEKLWQILSDSPKFYLTKIPLENFTKVRLQCINTK